MSLEGQFRPRTRFQFAEGELAHPALTAAAELEAKVGVFNTGTGALNSDVVITGVGFQPKVVIFWSVGRTGTTDAIGATHDFRMFGVAVSTTERMAVATASQEAVSAMVANSTQVDDCCFASVTYSGGAPNGKLDLQSFDADGFTLNVDDVMPASYRVHYLALGGDALTNAAIDWRSQPASPGNQSFVDVGFDPDLLLMGTNRNAVDTLLGHSALQICAANRVIEQLCVWQLSTGGGADDEGGGNLVANEFIQRMDYATGATLTARVAVNAFPAGGYQLNHIEATTAISSVYPIVALKGVQSKIGTLMTRTDANPIVVSGLGFTPKVVIFVSNGLDGLSPSDEVDVGAKFCIGFADGATQGAQAVKHVNGAATSNIGTAVEHDSVYINISATEALDGLMALDSLDAAGFTCHMTNADPSAVIVGYIAIG